MINSINELADYFNRNKFPCVFHQVGKNIFDVFIMEENYTKIVFDLEWELQSHLEIRFQPLKSKSEFRRINSMFEAQMKKISLQDAKGEDLTVLGEIMGVKKCGSNLKSQEKLPSKRIEETSELTEKPDNSSQ